MQSLSQYLACNSENDDESYKDIFCYVNRVTYEKHLRMGDWLSVQPTLLIRGLKLSALSPLTSKEGRGAGKSNH